MVNSFLSCNMMPVVALFTGKLALNILPFLFTFFYWHFFLPKWKKRTKERKMAASQPVDIWLRSDGNVETVTGGDCVGVLLCTKRGNYGSLPMDGKNTGSFNRKWNGIFKSNELRLPCCGPFHFIKRNLSFSSAHVWMYVYARVNLCMDVWACVSVCTIFYCVHLLRFNIVSFFFHVYFRFPMFNILAQKSYWFNKNDGIFV